MSFPKYPGDEIFHFIDQEKARQENGIELIASENYTSPAVMRAQGSILTNKYAEGYPQKRYYDGCEFVDKIEQIAIDRCNQLFGTTYANVQPHSGSSANLAAYFSLLCAGDKILGMDLSQGGHLTHGSPVNFSGKLFQFVSYGLDQKTEQIDYNHLEEIAVKEKPKMIIAGASAYSRYLDFEKFSLIAKKVGAYLLVDMAHIAGLVATGFHPSPVGFADIITSTTHKTLRGPRGGIILATSELGAKVNSSIFPGHQGGPLEHVIAAKAIAFKEAMQPEFKIYQENVIKNAQTLAQTLQKEGIELVSNGTDNHLILFKTNNLNLSGKEASHLLDQVGITCNKNMIPGDTRSPFVTSGVRIGTPAITTRGFKTNECEFLGSLIVQILKNPTSEKIKINAQEEIKKLCLKFPVYS